MNNREDKNQWMAYVPETRMTKETFLRFIESNSHDIAKSPMRYFELLWQYRNSISANDMKELLSNLDVREFDVSIVEKIRKEIQPEDLSKLPELAEWASLHSDICKLILTRRPEELSGAQIYKLQISFDENQFNIDALINRNSLLNDRCNAWRKFMDLASRIPLPTDEIMRCINVGAFSQVEIFKFLYNFELTSNFFRQEKLRCCLPDQDWLDLSWHVPGLREEILQSSFAAKVPLSMLKKWKALDADKLVGKKKYTSSILEGLKPLQQNENYNNLYVTLADAVSIELAVGEGSAPQQQRFIGLSVPFSINFFEKINEVLGSKTEAAKSFAAQVRAVFLQQLNAARVDKEKPIDLTALMEESEKLLYCPLGEYYFRQCKFTGAARLFKKSASLDSQAPHVQFYAQACDAILSIEDAIKSKSISAKDLPGYLEKLTQIIGHRLAPEYPKQMAYLISCRAKLFDIAAQLVKQQSENTEITSWIEWDKGCTLYKKVFNSLDSCSANTRFAEAAKLLKQSIDCVSLTSQAKNQAKVYLMNIYWLQGDFKQAYDLGVQVLPGDHLVKKPENDIPEKIIVANRMGFCLLQLEERYQQDKSLAEKYFSYAANLASAESEENILALIGKASCWIKDKNVLFDEPSKMLQRAYQSACETEKLGEITYTLKSLACSQIMAMMQIKSPQIDEATLKEQMSKFLTLVDIKYADFAVPQSLLNKIIVAEKAAQLKSAAHWTSEGSFVRFQSKRSSKPEEKPLTTLLTLRSIGFGSD